MDESKKPLRDRATGKVGSDEHYIVAAAIVLAGDMEEIRTELARIQAKFGSVLHYGDFSKQRRTQVVDAINSIAGWDGYLFETVRPVKRHYKEAHIRSRTLTEAFVYLGAESVKQAVLETRAGDRQDFQRLDESDHEILNAVLSRKQVPANFRIRHANKTEPILQIADVLAGSRSDFLCGINQEIYPRIAHRVRCTRAVV